MKRLVLITVALTGASLSSPIYADYDAAVLANNPAAYWRMNEPAGAVAANDSSGNGGSGLYLNGVTLGVPGALVEDGGNTAALYDGVTDGSSATAETDRFTGSVAGLGNDYSVEFWFRNDRPIDDTLDIAGYIVSRGAVGGTSDSIGLWGDASLPRRMFLFNGIGTIVQDITSTQITPGTWYHVGVTRQGNDLKLYLNGNLELSGSFAPTFTGTNFNAGTRADGGWPFKGGIDELAVYNTVLTGEDFTAHYLASIPEPTSTVLLLAPATLTLLKRRGR